MMKQKKIMVVDDEKEIVDFVAHNLECEEFTVIKAYNGKALLIW
jgi:DNA-binding response OmpR family regulator